MAESQALTVEIIIRINISVKMPRRMDGWKGEYYKCEHDDCGEFGDCKID
jgi:hypothetical protein